MIQVTYDACQQSDFEESKEEQVLYKLHNISSSSSELGDEALKQCKHCVKISSERWFQDEMRQEWIIDICENCQYILFCSSRSCLNITTAAFSSLSFENVSGLPSDLSSADLSSAALSSADPSSAALSSAALSSAALSSADLSDQSTGQPFIQVWQGKKRMNSQTAVEVSKKQLTAKRTCTESIRKPSRKVQDNTADEEELKRINMAQNAKKKVKKRQQNSQNKARQQLNKLLLSWARD